MYADAGAGPLADWKSNHRPLAEEHRQSVASYLEQCLKHDPIVARWGPDHPLMDETRDTLWRRFRERYDGMLGSGRPDRQDVFIAMRVI